MSSHPPGAASSFFAMICANLHTAVLGDVMDDMGLTRQFLPPRIRPLDRSMMVAGRAMPVLVADREPGGSETDSAPPFGRMLKALDSLRENQVYICTGGSPEYALWGELMSTRATQLGAAGAVIDGYYRDSAAISRLKFPTFGYGSYAQDLRRRGTVVDFGIPIEIGGVKIKPLDVVVGDRDGVCVIPSPNEVIVVKAAMKKLAGENSVRKSIRKGQSSQAAFERYGVM